VKLLMSIEQYRKKIIDITERIIELVGERERMAEKIAMKKRDNKIPIDDAGAEEKLIDSVIKKSRNLKLILRLH
jgi:hypothetical protein